MYIQYPILLVVGFVIPFAMLSLYPPYRDKDVQKYFYRRTIGSLWVPALLSFLATSVTSMNAQEMSPRILVILSFGGFALLSALFIYVEKYLPLGGLQGNTTSNHEQ